MKSKNIRIIFNALNDYMYIYFQFLIYVHITYISLPESSFNVTLRTAPTNVVTEGETSLLCFVLNSPMSDYSYLFLKFMHAYLVFKDSLHSYLHHHFYLFIGPKAFASRQKV